MTNPKTSVAAVTESSNPPAVTSGNMLNFINNLKRNKYF